jgi:glycosyltransferase involved in cell wall biosynthesis
MKTIIFIGNHKSFCGKRLGTQLASYLAARGHEVLLAGAKKNLPSYTSFAHLKLPAVLSVKNIENALKKDAPAQLISLAFLPACEAAHNLKIPFIYAEPEDLKEDKPVKNKKALLKAAKRVIVIGSNESTLNKKMYASNAVRIANPAVWTEHQNYNKPAYFKKQNNLVAIGNLTKDGGFDVLLKVWADLAPAHPSWHLTIAGDGTAKTALKKFIEKNNLAAGTELVCTDCDPLTLLRCADIYVHPSPKEDALDFLLDAMASKLPAVAVQTGAAQALVRSGINGVLVDHKDEEALRIALDDLMVNWGKRVDMAVSAAQIKEQFPFENFAALFEIK